MCVYILISVRAKIPAFLVCVSALLFVCAQRLSIFHLIALLPNGVPYGYVTILVQLVGCSSTITIILFILYWK